MVQRALGPAGLGCGRAEKTLEHPNGAPTDRIVAVAGVMANVANVAIIAITAAAIGGGDDGLARRRLRSRVGFRCPQINATPFPPSQGRIRASGARWPTRRASLSSCHPPWFRAPQSLIA